ncbi:MAG: family 43 glycosylhydrolase [Clostridiales bacterium]|nr:family 43 glycosylhydrolase [Clostridiales bacterium]
MKNQVLNPYLPSYEYVPDGEPHVFGDRLYIFGSHDRYGAKAFCENDYVCWSAPLDDLSDWRYDGIIYRKRQDPKNKILNSTMYAPDVCSGADGRYYLYYGLNFLPVFGVAVCDTPAGTYEFLGHVRHPDGKLYGRGKNDAFPFDPGVLNDDGRIYLCSGFSPKDGLMRRGIDALSRVKGANGNQILELCGDMLTVKSVKPLIPGTDNSKGTGFEGHEFYEASSLRKFNGKYYFIYSTVASHELAYAVSEQPDRGFRFGGVLHSNCDLGFNGNSRPLAFWGNNHGSIECIGGKYYVFGHRHTNYRECNRQGVAEELTGDGNGGFAMAEMTSCGLNGKPLGTGKYEAGIACNLFAASGAEKSVFFRDKAKTSLYPCIMQKGPDREGAPCQYIHNMRRGSVAGFKYFECDCTQITVTARSDGGTLEILFSPDGEPVAKIRLEDSRDEAEYTTRLKIPGKQALYFRYAGEGSADIMSFRLA